MGTMAKDESGDFTTEKMLLHQHPEFADFKYSLAFLYSTVQ